MKRGSSLRFIDTPTEYAGFASMVIAVSLVRCGLNSRRRRLAKDAGRLLHCLDDVLIAGTPAQVAGEPFADVGLARRGVALEQRIGGQQHAGRAVAALQAVLIPEPLLKRMQVPTRGQSFDGEDLVAL